MSTEQSYGLANRNWSSHPRPEMYVGRKGDSRSVEEISPVFRHIFSDFTQFNEIQSLVIDDMLYTDKSLVLSAPTGSGKTAIFELAMIRLLMKLEDADYEGDFRMIYIAPIKALCTEKFNDWKPKFERIGVKTAEVTGDTEMRDFWDLPDCNLILTTPEKWNSITRRWRQNVNFVRLIKLVMIDEVHILNDQSRGPVLEAVVSRMRSIHRFVETGEQGVKVEPMRIIALSATAPNVADLAAWVGEGNTICFYNISESRRPIKIDKHVLGYYCDPTTNPFRFDMNLNYKLSEVIAKYSSGRPSLIFCSTRKATETASNHLVEHHSLRLTPDQMVVLQNIADQLQSGDLKRRLLAGVGYHHAGLSISDRQLIEDSFRAGRIPVLCCTSGLAMGVNLPAHLVIIKSTQMYTDYGLEEYPESSIFQMIGRAGRPQFDTFGVAVIMTQRENVQRYERLATGSVPIESYLHEHLAEHLNSEIVLQTITDLASAMDWIRSTFLYVRALAAPARYGLPPNLDKAQIETKLEELCLAELNALEKYSLIGRSAKDQGGDSGMTISATLYGRLMAQYCLNFRTVKLLRKIKGTEPLLEMFTLLTYCDEFTVFKCRNSDKRTLNELNRSTTSSTIRFPLRGRIQTTTAMVSCLMQAVFGNLPIEDGSLQQEATKMINVGRRLIKCMAEFIYASRDMEDYDGEGGVYQALLSTLRLSQCLETKLWENSPFIAKQLKGIGMVYAGQLAARGKISFQELMESDPRELEVILKKNPPFGSDLIAFVRTLPVFSIDLVMKEDYVLQLTVVQANNCYNKKLAVKISILIGDSNNNVLFFKENFDANPGGSNRYQESFKLSDATVATATGHVICASWTGLDCSKTITINEDIMNNTSKSTTEKQRPKNKTCNNNSSKKITEFYRKENPKLAEFASQIIPDVASIHTMDQPDKNGEVILVEDSPNPSRFLESFRFTQKPKMSIDKQDADKFTFVSASDLKGTLPETNESTRSLNLINPSEYFGGTSSLKKTDFTFNNNSGDGNNFGFFDGVVKNQSKLHKYVDTATLNNSQSSVDLLDRSDRPITTDKTNFVSMPDKASGSTTMESTSKRLKLDDSMNDSSMQSPLTDNQSSDESQSDSSSNQSKKVDFFSPPIRQEESNQSKTSPELAVCIPSGPPRYVPSNRMQYFTEMHRRDPFILFGRPEDYAAQQERQRSAVRRICLFGVYMDVPRQRDEGPMATRLASSGSSVASERQVFRTMYSVEGDNKGGRFYRKNYHHAREGRRELDLGINEFLSSASDQQDPPKENFFK
ncbi:probable ATP-dependent DNA helicase HFM1 [Armigeres subalbatus]|uniref:probable ATP-dependent DNA helicase HFM1 n=1 Tax=Armigeres subalbatus TaxID=124917 RepID=UPI002ED15227